EGRAAKTPPRGPPHTSSHRTQTSTNRPQTSSNRPQTSSNPPQTSSHRPQTSSNRPQALSSRAQALSGGTQALSGGEMEVEIPDEPPPPTPRGKQRAIAPPAPAPQAGIDLDPNLPAEQPEALPDDAILTLQAEDLVAAPHDEEVISREEFVRQTGPIADLLSSDAEEEVELLS